MRFKACLCGIWHTVPYVPQMNAKPMAVVWIRRIRIRISLFAVFGIAMALLQNQDFSSLRIRSCIQEGSQNNADRDPYQQCCGSVTFWFRSGSADLCPLTNGSGSAARSCCYRHWPSRRQQQTILFLLITFWRYVYINFQR